MFSDKAFPLSIRIVIFCIFVVTAFLTRYYSDYQTTLSPGVFVMSGSSVLKANEWSVPVVYDWNSDGKKDLLVGNRSADENGRSTGYVYFYENDGDDVLPSFNGSRTIHACADICSPLNVAAEG